MEPIQPSKSSIAYQPTTLGGTSDLGRLANHPHLKEEEKMEAVAKEFEVMLVKQVLKSAQQPMTDSGSTLFPTQGTGAIYGDMMVDTLAGSIGRAGQLGLAYGGLGVWLGSRDGISGWRLVTRLAQGYS